MKVLPRKEFQEVLYKRGISQGLPEEEAARQALATEAIHLDPEGEILISKGSTLGVKLHEVGHKVLGPSSKYSNIETGKHTIGDDILDEILAEKFSYDIKGKKPTYRLALPAINMLVSTHYNLSPEAAVFWSLYILRKELGVTATKRERRELARHARGLHRRPGG